MKLFLGGSCVFSLLLFFFLSSGVNEQFLSQPGREHEVIIHKFRSPCYTTKHGLSVGQFRTKCPSISSVEKEVDRLLTRMGLLGTRALEGLQMAFSPSELICGDKGWKEYEIVWGCTNFDPVRMTVMLEGDRYMWGQVLSHELGHFLRVFALGLGPDGDHEDTEFWRMVEDIDG